jgi:16S rRNA (guanine966-N2)-methyltransferase
VRIIAGEWRGRRISAPKSGPVRPTADRVREAWMSIVQMELPGARALDLFAGSGALGLEALSRGASFVDLVEEDARTLRVLQANVDALGAGDRCSIHRADAIAFAKRLHDRAPYDLCFADPPYRLGLAVRLAQCWIETPFATIFGVEHEARESLPAGGDTRRYGDTAITFYRT